MKQLIIMTAMISLGCIMFQFIAGGEDSVYSSVRNVWAREVEICRSYP